MNATYAVCVNNDNYPASLEVGKIYRTLADDHAAKHNLVRVIDESFEDYLYPDTYFTPFESTVIGHLADELRKFGNPMWLGWIPASDAGMLMMDPSPDLAFFTPGRIADEASVEAYAEGIPDLVVEMKSHSDILGNVSDNAQEWLSRGASLAWILYPDTCSVDIHSQDGLLSRLQIEDTLYGGDVLPGFACSVRDIFEREIGVS